MLEAFSQLASTSAVLGGFAFAFLGAIISGGHRSRAVTGTTAFTLPSAACFVLCALGWSLTSVWLASPLADQVDTLPDFITSVHAILSFAFLIGIAAFFGALGFSGWIYSHVLGYVSTVCAVLASILAVFVVKPFLIVAG